ncbi:BamA/TamA family outer membrane protein [Marinilongibacter aquaticus]|uniref:BamA/TamA family outer membrane protein n=1 Tax=Marinilongibacter aquaticus TaxID=2975157 RepID=UPI0021BD3EE9|nr:BamA/TamA family outer membrane protein [Marinilongibacter aquaticus]UBM58122.1 BamA/TamA family outer membrane protein [Marinilongibacter aquaticus]
MSKKCAVVFLLGMIFTQCVLAGTAVDSLVVGDVTVSGNHRTRSSIILRELSFSCGDTLSPLAFQNELERSRRNIMQTDLFIWVEAHADSVGEVRNVIFTVKEKLYFLPLPIFYLADRSFNEWWYNRDHDFKRVIYGVMLNHDNLTGNGDRMKVKLYGGFIPYIELVYNRPYIDKRQRMGLKAGVFYAVQRSFPYRTWEDKLDFLDTEKISKRRKGAYLEYSLRNALYHSHTFYLGLSEISVRDSVLQLNPHYFAQNERHLPFLTLSYDYRYDKRDNAFYPLDGEILTFSLTHYSFLRGNQTNHLRIGGQYFKFFPLGNKFFGDIRLRGQLSFPQKQLYPFVLGLGYNNTFVRGYELNVIDGQHTALMQNDLKYQIFKKKIDLSHIIKWRQFNSMPLGIYAKVFFDLGYSRNFHPEYSQSILSNKLLFGYGAGIDLATFYSTVLKLNYSVNQSGFNKLYFGVQRSL